MSKGWGFKIDYAKAIADDDARIGWAELSMRRGWYKRPVGDHGYVISELWELILYFPDAARAAGLSLQDVADYARVVDADLAWTHNPELPEARQDAAGWKRGHEVDAEIARIGGWLFADEAAAKLELKRAKASRARHIRNREQYGRR
jgi:hypothetical protein